MVDGESKISTEQKKHRAKKIQSKLSTSTMEVRNCGTVEDVFKLVDAAIKDRDSERIIAMVKALPAIAKYTNSEGMTILFKVTREGLSKRVVYTLLKYGADPSIVDNAFTNFEKFGEQMESQNDCNSTFCTVRWWALACVEQS